MIPYVIVRPTNNYGIGQYVEKLIPKAVKYLTIGRQIDLHQNGTPVRTWLHVDDTARAVSAIIDAGVKNDIFNISGNYELQNRLVISKIINLVHGDVNNIDPYLRYMTRPGQDVRYAINDDKLKALGWSPKADFDTELVKIVDYYTKNFVW
jgi:dTDP-glucose 4,6-dehydratase